MQDRLKEIQDKVDNVSGDSWVHLFGDEIIYEKLEDGCRGLPIARAALGNHCNNAQFIANARQDIPFLLSALQDAQSKNKGLQLTIDCMRSSSEQDVALLEQAEAREQGLRTAIKPFADMGEKYKNFIPNPNSEDILTVRFQRNAFVNVFKAFNQEPKP